MNSSTPHDKNESLKAEFAAWFDEFDDQCDVREAMFRSWCESRRRCQIAGFAAFDGAMKEMEAVLSTERTPHMLADKVSDAAKAKAFEWLRSISTGGGPDAKLAAIAQDEWHSCKERADLSAIEPLTLELAEELFGCFLGRRRDRDDLDWENYCKVCEKGVDILKWVHAPHEPGCAVSKARDYLAKRKPECVRQHGKDWMASTDGENHGG